MLDATRMAQNASPPFSRIPELEPAIGAWEEWVALLHVEGLAIRAVADP